MENFKKDNKTNISNSNIPSKKKQKMLMRDKRNKQYEDIAKECSNLNISEIRVEDFAEARKKELQKFIQILNSKYNTKGGFQLLPKHMRRRQMSHNPFRIPVRNRTANLNVNIKSRCKKHKKKNRFLKISIIKRANRNNWLESHIWHAKRFRMKRIFNYTIAVNRLDKGFKACYRYSKYDSCIYDSSYYNYLIIDTNTEYVLPLFEKILKLSSLNNFSNLKKLQNYRINLYDLKTKRLIGPCSIILLDTSIITIFHPLMREEIVKLFQDINDIEDNHNFMKIHFNNVMNNFSLLGPRIAENIFKILKSLIPDNQSNLINKFDNSTEFTNFLNLLNENEILIFETFSPKSKFKMNEFVFRELMKENFSKTFERECVSEDLNSFCHMNNLVNNENLKKTFLLKSHHLQEIKQDELNPNKNYIAAPTERTVFMHRKNVKLDVLNKKLENSIREYKKKDKNKKINIQAIKTDSKNEMQIDNSPPLHKLANTDEKIFFILVKNTIDIVDYDNKRINTPVYNLIFPKGYSHDLLRRFVYLETRPIGLREYKYYLKNSNSFIFPDDFPSTNSYQKYIKEKTIKMIDKYCRFPSSKRVNFQKIGNPYPFYSAWQRLNKKIINSSPSSSFNSFNQDVEIVCDLTSKEKIQRQLTFQNILTTLPKIFLIPVSIEMVGKGIPSFNSLICLPAIEDIQILNKILRYRKKSKAKNLIDKISESVGDYKNIMMRLNDKEDFSDKIAEGKYLTDIKNKHFNVEYETIKKEILSKTEEETELNYSSDILNKDLTIKLPGNKEISREVIGFVTSGQFSFMNSKGIAKGFIHVSSYENLIKIKNEISEDKTINNPDKNDCSHVFGLIRKNTSRNYYFSKIQIVKMN